MTDNLEELERLLAKATGAPWQYRDDYTTEGFVTIVGNVDGEYDTSGGPHYTYEVVCRCEDEFGERLPNVAANVRSIVALRNAAPSLIATAREVERLRAEVARLTDELRKANEPLWFYAEGNEERCLFSPDDAIDWLDLAAGEYVTEVSTARPCKSIWCAVRVTDDRDADERFTFTEHSTELEARAALYARGLSIVRKETVNG